MDPFFVVTAGSRGSPGTLALCPQAPRPLELALRRDADWPFSSTAALEAPTAPAVSPPPSLCRCVLVETCSLQLGLCRSLMRVPAGPGSRQGLTLEFQTSDPDSARARRPSLRQWKAHLATLSSRLGRGHHPWVLKASWASQEKSCAVNDLEKSVAPAESPPLP